MKRYAEYKDSGIPWIGTIPSEWRIGRSKYNYYLKGRIGWQGLKSDEFVDNTPYYLVTGTDFCNGRVDWDVCYHITKERYEEAPEIHVQSGDLLVTKDGTIGKVAYIEDKPYYVSLNSHLLLMRPLNDQFDNRFLFWVIQCQVFENYYGATQSGSIMASLSQEKISNFAFPLPSKDEQSEIANYLEKRANTIVSMIDEAKASIEEYKAWKASIIYEAVTKGLDKNVEMKDSGVEWQKSIPVDWSFQRLKFLTTDIVDCPHETPEYAPDGKYYVIRTADQDFARLRDDQDMYRLNESEYINRIRRLSLDKDDIVYGREGERWGLACLVPESGKYCLGQRMMQFRCKTDVFLPSFAVYALSSPDVRRQGEYDTLGSTSPHVNISTIKNYYIPVPNSLSEQDRIAKYLNEQTNLIDSLVSEKESLISDLESYKKSLIFETVTGKRKVV